MLSRVGILMVAFAAIPAGASGPLRTPHGEVVAPHPQGAGWICETTRRAGDGFELAEIKCSREKSRGLLFLFAKDYFGPAETLDAICSRDWRRQFAPVIPSMTSVTAKIVVKGKRRVCAIDVEGTAAKGEVHKIEEWRAVAPRHVLIITASGSAETVKQYQGEVETWFDGVRFGALGEK